MLGRNAIRAALIAATCCAAGLAFAQNRGGPDTVDFALSWARGGFASPIVCRFGEKAERGLRRVVIEPGPRTSEQRVVRVKFLDLAAAGAERCTDELGADEPNVAGTIYVTYDPRRPRSDTPQRDFQLDLDRGPIEYQIVRGLLRVGPGGKAPASLPDTDFAGGTLRLSNVKPGSDDARRIADLPGARALKIEVAAKNGTAFAFPVVELETR